ncbi:MAG: diguanylate cyclase [Devosia sp.]|nr:diguanylate cyclase [Devosia sp.]
MRRNWRFSYKVLVPVLLAVVVTFGAAVGFILWSTSRSDDRALERQTRLVGHMLARAHGDIADQQQDITGWDEAVHALRNKPDLTWIDRNLGASTFADYQHNRIYVLDPQLNPIYAMRDGGGVPPATFEPDRASIAPLVDRLRSVDGDAAIASYNNGFGDIPGITDFGLVGDRPALVSAVPILSESEELNVAPGSAFFHVAVRFLDDALADELTDQFMLENAHFSASPMPAAGEAVLPILDSSGAAVAWFKWTPERPGSEILADTIPALLGVLAAAGVVIAFLIRRLRRSSAELEEARADAQHRAQHDPLTGLANRSLFQERLTHALEGLSRGGDPIALLALDLDRFKQVNDTLGHEAGDQLLRQVAERLKGLLRDTDTLARLGGDEFVILQATLRTVAEARALSERIISRISEPYPLAGQDVRIGVSIGVAVAIDAARDGLDLPARADFALYQAKEAGRNQVRLYDESRDRRASEAAA